jgi:ribosomal protein S8
MYDLHFMKIPQCLTATGVCKSRQKELLSMKVSKNQLECKKLEYKGYIGVFDYDEDADLFEGSLINIEDLIFFQGKSIESLTSDFKDAVNDYIELCKKMGKEPGKLFSLP